MDPCFLLPVANQPGVGVLPRAAGGLYSADAGLLNLLELCLDRSDEAAALYTEILKTSDDPALQTALRSCQARGC